MDLSGLGCLMFADTCSVSKKSFSNELINDDTFFVEYCKLNACNHTMGSGSSSNEELTVKSGTTEYYIRVVVR